MESQNSRSFKRESESRSEKVTLMTGAEVRVVWGQEPRNAGSL